MRSKICFYGWLSKIYNIRWAISLATRSMTGIFDAAGNLLLLGLLYSLCDDDSSTRKLRIDYERLRTVTYSYHHKLSSTNSTLEIRKTTTQFFFWFIFLNVSFFSIFILNYDPFQFTIIFLFLNIKMRSWAITDYPINPSLLSALIWFFCFVFCECVFVMQINVVRNERQGSREEKKRLN